MKDFFNLIYNFLDLRGVEKLYLSIFIILSIAMGISVIASAQSLYIFAYANLNPLKNVMGFDFKNDALISTVSFVFAVAVESLQALAVFVFAEKLTAIKTISEHNKTANKIDKKESPKILGVTILMLGAILFNGSTMYYGTYTQEKIKELSVLKQTMQSETKEQEQLKEVISDLNQTTNNLKRKQKILLEKENNLDANEDQIKAQLTKERARKVNERLEQISKKYKILLSNEEKKIRTKKASINRYESIERGKLSNHEDNYKAMYREIKRRKKGLFTKLNNLKKAKVKEEKEAKISISDVSIFEAAKSFRSDMNKEILTLKADIKSLKLEQKSLRNKRDKLKDFLKKEGSGNATRLLNYKLRNTEYPKKLALGIMAIALFFGYFKGMIYVDIVNEARKRKDRKKNRNKPKEKENILNTPQKKEPNIPISQKQHSQPESIESLIGIILNESLKANSRDGDGKLFKISHSALKNAGIGFPTGTQKFKEVTDEMVDRGLLTSDKIFVI